MIASLDCSFFANFFIYLRDYAGREGNAASPGNKRIFSKILFTAF